MFLFQLAENLLLQLDTKISVIKFNVNEEIEKKPKTYFFIIKHNFLLK